MPTKRHTLTCRHPLFFSAVLTLGIASLFAVLFTSLAQAHGLPRTGAAALRQGAVAADEPALEYAPGVVLVKLKAAAAESLAQPGMAAAQAMDVSAAGAAKLFRSYGVTSAEPLFAAAVFPSGYSAQAAQDGADTLSRVYKLHLDPQVDARQIAAALAADANVEYAEPDYIARGMRIPNDPDYGSQWALAKIGAPAAWDLQTGSPAAVIAVIDSGVDTAHPEFTGRLWDNDDPLDGVDNDLNGQVDDLHGWNVLANNNDLADPSGHGTQVGGVIGAAADNGVGVAGMCWNCKLMFVKAMQANGAANYSDVAKAVQYAASNGAQVINLSLGGYADSAVLHDAIREAATTAVIVAGAGNDDSANVFYPAAYPEVLAVAATDQNDQKTVFSNYGPWVDVTAPGTDIRTTTVGGYATGSGTSLSTAVVSGLAGLVKSQHPAWTAEQVKWQILNTAANLDPANPTRLGQLGRGRVDAGAALAVAPLAKAAVQSYSIDGQANGRPAPGQSFQLVITIQNQWLPAENLQGTLASSDPYVSITDGAGSLGDLASGETGSNAADSFGIAVSGSAPYNRQLGFTLNLSGAGGYSLALPFTIQVRSATETLGNTQYVQDTTWTSDKTYVLGGSVIVGQGVTLTIQPGTVIKADVGKFIRIDGTLIAAGTSEQPIVFASSSGGARWGGLRFSDSAVDTVYDGDGAYAGGSVLRHVEMTQADIGVELGSRSLLVADSLFHGNDTSIHGSGSSSRIERSRFVDAAVTAGATYITINALGSSHDLIRWNEFASGEGGIAGYGAVEISGNTFHDIKGIAVNVAGSPTVVDNVFIDNDQAAIQVGGDAYGRFVPSVHGNAVTGNGAGIRMWVGTQENVAGSGIYQNTIINNRGAGIDFSAGTTGTFTIVDNNLFGNGTYDLYLNNGSIAGWNYMVDATNNFWNLPEATIASRIRDCTFDENGCAGPHSTVGKATYLPALAAPAQTAPAFVRTAALDPDPVGLQRGTITIDFSRPMSTSIAPAAQFHDARRGVLETVWSPEGPYGSPKPAKDASGRIWLGRSATLLMYNMRQWYTYTVPAGNSNNISALYGASNGDMWVGVCCGDTALARLRGTTWTTYTQQVIHSANLYGVNTIAEDAGGAVWFGTGFGAFRFDGSTWKRYTADDGIRGVEIFQIARDGQGRMWLLAFNSSTKEAALNVFDGQNWISYGDADGLPRTYTGPMFADSKGRIWVNVFNGTTSATSTIVAMFDGVWHFFGSQASNGKLINPVSAFGEATDGTIWMRSGGAYGAAVLYRDGVWDTEDSLVGTGDLVIDPYDNVWFGVSMDTADVLWRGRDYTFENGHWLSDTRFQAEYTFTPDVPPAGYVIDVAGAVDSAGMAAYATGMASFTVDFGAGVSLDPPYPPSVAAQTTGSLANLAASWTAAGAQIDQYRYAIGTAPGARNIVGWTYLIATSFARDDLSLTPGQTYYVTVQAHNSSGIWSANGVSNGVVGGQAATQTFIQPGTGGTQAGQFGSLDLSLRVPPNAIGEPIRLAMQPAATPPSTGGLAILGQSFAINAETAGGAPVTQFAVPLVLVIHYTDAAAAGLDESRLQIFYWNEAQQQWVGVPTIVDAQANTLTVYLDHLTLFAALEVEARNPSLYLPQIRR